MSQRYNNRSRELDDRYTCGFYKKIGACRHGEKCSKKHIKPATSETILLPNLYQNPKLNKNEGESLNPRQLEEYFDHFYQDIFIKFSELGVVTNLVVCENENHHLNGNVYVKFKSPDSAYNAVMTLNQEWYDGRPVHCELSPVDNFQEANCRAYETDTCNRGDHCNFMHVRKPRQELKSNLFRAQDKSFVLKRLEEIKQTGPAPPDKPAPESTPNSTPGPGSGSEISPNGPNLSSVAAVEKLFAK